MTMTSFLAHGFPPGRLLGAALVLALGQAAAAPAPGPEAIEQQGRQSMAEGEYGGAVRDFAQAVRLRPGDATALNNLAVATAAAGDLHGALALFLRARKAAPARADIARNLANLTSWARHYGEPATEPVSSGVNAPPPPLWRDAPPLAPAPACEGVACK